MFCAHAPWCFNKSISQTSNIHSLGFQILGNDFTNHFFDWAQMWDVLFFSPEQVLTLQMKFYLEKRHFLLYFLSMSWRYISTFTKYLTVRIFLNAYPNSICYVSSQFFLFAGYHIFAILKPPSPYLVSSFSKPYPGILIPQSFPWLNHVFTILILSCLSLILMLIHIIDKALM